MDVLIILQARVSSTRLPGKVLNPILGKAMLAHQIARINQAKCFDKLVVATSTNQEDQAIADLCKELNVDCFQGSLNDVLDRFYQTAQKYQPKHIVRLTGDCPLIDAEIIDQVVELHKAQNADYTSNCNPPTFPDGLDVEVFTFNTLKTIYPKAVTPQHREHVTLYINQNGPAFSIANFRYSKDLSNHRWTVDEPEDFKFVTTVYEKLYPVNKHFSMLDILNLIENTPEIKQINHQFHRNEGLAKS